MRHHIQAFTSEPHRPVAITRTTTSRGVLMNGAALLSNLKVLSLPSTKEILSWPRLAKVLGV